MGVPLSQVMTVTGHVLKQKLMRRKRYPLVLMLEVLFKCNLACAGCGKIQYPAQILKKRVSVEQCLGAVEECGAPIVSIPGGEPLLYPEIGELVEELVRRKKYVYLCTNAILLKKKLDEGLFKPSKYLTFSIHLDGLREDHDQSVCQDGVYDKAVEAARHALALGYRVTTNTTLFEGAEPQRVREFFDEMTELGVEGMMVSPGYSYSKAPDQEHFLRKQTTNRLFSEILTEKKKGWKFNQSPLFLQFLMGKQDYECTPWGNPTFNVFRVAEALLPTAGRVRPQLQAATGRDQVGRLRQGQRQPQVQGLHGPFRVRGHGRRQDVRELEGFQRLRSSHHFRQTLAPSQRALLHGGTEIAGRLDTSPRRDAEHRAGH